MAKQKLAEERGVMDSGWIILAKSFPAGLNKLVASEVLSDGQTPDAYGLGLDEPGYLYADSIPTGYEANPFYTAVTEPTCCPDWGLTWYYWFDRLWAISDDGLSVYYGAYGYKTNFIYQRRGLAGFYATGGKTYTSLAPFGNNMALFSADGVDVIQNANSPNGDFAISELIKTEGCSADNRAVFLGSNLYFINANGVWTIGNYMASEVTEIVRTDIAPFSTDTSTVLQYDERRKLVVGLDGDSNEQFAIQEQGENLALFDYSTTGFRFTTTTFMASGGNPLAVDKIAIIYKTTGTDKKYLSFEVKINDDWKSEGRRNIVDANEKGRIEFPINNAYACRRWAVRLTELSSNVYISSIQAKIKQGGVIGYSE
jgi:hypothetical protein